MTDLVKGATDSPAPATIGSTPFLTDESSWQRRAEWILVALGMVVYVELRHWIDGDAAVRYSALVDLVEQHRLSHMRYSIVQELASIPLYLLGAPVRDSFGFVAHFNMLVFFAGLGALFALLHNRLDAILLRRFLLLLVGGSMFPYPSKNYYAEIFSSMAVAIGLLLFSIDRFRLATASVVAGVVNVPASFRGLVLVAVDNAYRSRRWRWMVPVAITGLLIVGEAWLRRGSPVATGYAGDAGARTVLPFSSRPGFSYPVILGVLSELLSFGKGLLFFAPGLLLLFAKRQQFQFEVEHFLRTCVLFLTGLILVYAKWWSWYGGWAWGPRFLLFASIPASLLLAWHISRAEEDRTGVRFLTFAILWLSVWVAANGAVFGQDGQGICQQNNYQLESLCWYVPEFSPLVLPFIAHRVLGVRDILMLGYFALVGAVLSVPVLREMARAPQRAPAIIDVGARAS